MTHKASASAGKEIEWGFDLTQVKSDNAFESLLKEYGFVKVKSEGSGNFGKRFAVGNTTFANPSGIRITVEHMGGKGDDAGFLGYIGMTAPKSAEGELKEFLQKFRGSRKVTGTDKGAMDGVGGIATYVKEENAYENPYITVQ